MRRLIYIIAFFFISSCNNDDYEVLQGHWHSVSLKDSKYYETLDIKDNVVVFNKYNRNGDYEESILNDFNGKLKFNVHRLGYDLDYYFKSDTLVIEEMYENKVIYQFKWLKSENSVEDIERDFSSNLMLDINLSYNRESIPIDSLNTTYAIINIGKLKKEFLNKGPYCRDIEYAPYYIQL